MKNLLALLALLAFCMSPSYSQSTTIMPGSVLPQVTTAQRTAITSPNGVLVFDTNTQSYWFRKSGAWIEIPAGGTPLNYWALNGTGGNVIKNTNSGGFWSANPTGLTYYSDNTTNPPTAPVAGDGTRLMWIPNRSAFRAGTVYDGYKSWDKDSVGLYSMAFGFNTKAKGKYATAMGYNTTAWGDNSTAMGNFTTASGNTSTAMGYNTTASGSVSTALGNFTTASGSYSTAMGYSSSASGYTSTATGQNTTASGSYSTAMGFLTQASGDHSTAMGRATSASGLYSTAMGRGTYASGDYSTTMGYETYASGFSSTAMGRVTDASGDYSTALGYKVNTYLQTGAFSIGDADPLNEGVTLSGMPNQFVARFYNGYYLLTSGDGSTANPRKGVSIAHNQTAWSSISDSTKKERFLAANGEDFLQKLRGLRLGSWNYKCLDPKPERFYGPMAQELFAAYGQDAHGTIGSDTLVSTLNLDGILFIYAQALEQRTSNLQKENDQLRKSQLENEMRMERKLEVVQGEMQSQNEALRAQLSTQASKIEELEILKERMLSLEALLTASKSMTVSGK